MIWMHEVLDVKQYDVEFYEDERGQCPVADWIQELDRSTSKESKSMLKKIYFQIERLENEGTGLGEPIIKHLDEQIWELRPVPNRILFGVMKGRRIILLHYFRKKTKKTPKNEIEKAKREYINWINRG
jgi:phage-related protein